MLFGIIALIVVGLSWTIVGGIMGQAPKKKIDPEVIQFCGATFGISAGLIISSFGGGGGAHCPLTLGTLLVCLSYFFSGFLNAIMLQLMSKAMQTGPNGIVWTIIQSAMVVPFLVGMIFFGVEPKLIRIAGVLLILICLALSGYSKDNSNGNSSGNGGQWKTLAFLAFLITGVSQTLSNLPSYYDVGRNISPVIRSVTLASGIFVVALTLITRNGKWKRCGDTFRSKWLWIFLFLWQFFNLAGAYLLLYPGMDALAKHGVGAIAYPLMVASCMVGFFLYSKLIIREKNTVLQYITLAGAVIGIVMSCC